MKGFSQKVLVTIVLCTLLHSGSPLTCYHCLERPKSTEKHLSCAYFDMSSKFHKDCKHSTFCMKRTSLFKLHNGTFVTIYVHKCADQSHKTMVQDKTTGNWNWATLLRHDLYNEGCSPHNDPSLLTETSHCFCNSDFCNKSSFQAVPSKIGVTFGSVIAILLSSFMILPTTLFDVS